MAVLLSLVVSSALAGAQPAAGVRSGATPSSGCSGGALSLELTAGSLPDGHRSLTDVCIPREAFYQVDLHGYRLVLGLAPLHGERPGRVAVATLTTPGELAATLVGIEDLSTDTVRWAYATGGHDRTGDATTVAGHGVTDVAEDTASLRVSITGTGTDLLTAQDPVAEQLRTVLYDAVSQLAG